MMQKVQGILPAGFTQVKYIEAGGNHFINTDVYITDMTDIIKATVAFTKGTFSDDSAICGGVTGRWGILIGSLTRQSPYTQKPLSVMIGASQLNTGKLIDLNDFIDVTVNPNNDTYTLDGDEYPVTNRWDRYAVTTAAYQLMNYNGKTSATSYMKLKYAEVVGKGIFIPCIRDSDNKVGMYNTITGTFLSNAGTGEFGYETMNGNYVAPTT